MLGMMAPPTGNQRLSDSHLLHGSTEDPVALMVRNLHRAQELHTECFHPRWIPLQACSVTQVVVALEAAGGGGMSATLDGLSQLTSQLFGLAHDLVGVESWEDASLARSHVVAPVPVVVLLFLHKQRVVHIQLQLISMSWNEPAHHQTRGIQLDSLGTSVYYHPQHSQ